MDKYDNLNSGQSVFFLFLGFTVFPPYIYKMRIICLYHIGVDNVYSDNNILLQCLYYLERVLKVNTRSI